jgi:hypothetical protein
MEGFTRQPRRRRFPFEWGGDNERSDRGSVNPFRLLKPRTLVYFGGRTVPNAKFGYVKPVRHPVPHIYFYIFGTVHL